MWYGDECRYLPEDSEYVGIDISPEMLAKAAQRLDDRPRETTLHEIDAQDLAFPDDSFETVISSLSTCTFPDHGAYEQWAETVPAATVALPLAGATDVASALVA